MIRVEKLGITDYPDALARMRAYVSRRADARRKADDESWNDELWLTEHPPVYTLGFASRPEHLRATGAIPIVTTERGGQVTYHGPGQAIAYLLLDLRRRKLGVRDLVCRIEDGIVHCLALYGLEGLRKPGAPGIYVRPKSAPTDGPLAKIASVGLKVSRGLTWHGVALNGCMDLEPFERIDPCGYPGLRMTDVCSEASTHVERIGEHLPDHLAAALIAAIDG